MSDPPILFCPQCNHVCKSLRGLAQYITHRPACWQNKYFPILDGITKQKPTFHQSFVQVNAPHANEAMEPLWQQHGRRVSACVVHATRLLEHPMLHGIYRPLSGIGIGYGIFSPCSTILTQSYGKSIRQFWLMFASLWDLVHLINAILLRHDPIIMADNN
jgi:hypothetical protein